MKGEHTAAIEKRRADAAEHSLERARRVEHIRRLMATGLEWSRLRAQDLAVEWGCSYSTIRDYSAEAARISRHNRVDDVDEIRETTIARLERIILEAMTANPMQLRVAVEASRELARVGGVTTAAPVQQIVFTDTSGRPTLAGDNLMRSALRACAEASSLFLLAHPGELDAAIAAGYEAGNSIAFGVLKAEAESEVSTTVENAPDVVELPPLAEAEDADFYEIEGETDGKQHRNGSNGHGGNGH